jgi:hypothetical protein
VQRKHLRTIGFPAFGAIVPEIFTEDGCAVGHEQAYRAIGGGGIAAECNSGGMLKRDGGFATQDGSKIQGKMKNKRQREARYWRQWMPVCQLA